MLFSAPAYKVKGGYCFPVEVAPVNQQCAFDGCIRYEHHGGECKAEVFSQFQLELLTISSRGRDSCLCAYCSGPVSGRDFRFGFGDVAHASCHPPSISIEEFERTTRGD